MFHTRAAFEYRQSGAEAILPRGGAVAGAFRAEVEATAKRQRLAAERALDAALADSFPASDPPSWTLGITHWPGEAEVTSDVEARLAVAVRQAAVEREDVMNVSPAAPTGRSFFKNLTTLAGAIGVALLVPFVILLIGLPIALVIRGVVEAASWLLALVAG